MNVIFQTSIANKSSYVLLPLKVFSSRIIHTTFLEEYNFISGKSLTIVLETLT